MYNSVTWFSTLTGYQTTKLPSYQTTRLPDYHATRLPGCQIPSYQTTMLYQTTRVPDYQATRLQGFQTTDGKNRRVTFGDLVPDKDSRSLFTSLHCTMSIGHFSNFFYHFSNSRRPLFTKSATGRNTVTDKNPLRFVDTRIRINPVSHRWSLGWDNQSSRGHAGALGVAMFSFCVLSICHCIELILLLQL